jgi:hypothetical protein
MFVALIIAGTSFLLLVIFARFFTLEQRAGRRFVLPRIRDNFDTLLTSVAYSLHRAIVYVTKYIITLSWYYSMHAFLKVMLKFLASIYYMVEKLLLHNRNHARRIRQDRKRANKSHLEVLTDHKDDTKLTELQKKRLKDKALKGS